MSLELDSRQRAMLAEMGVQLWWPEKPPLASEPPNAQALSPDAVVAARSRPAASPPLPVPPRSVVPAAAAARAAVAAPQVAAVRSDLQEMDWDALEHSVSACRACVLCERRHRTVFGVGSRQARWMIVGEAPGENEDLQGEPFVGPAGKLLDNMLRAIGLNRHGEAAQAVFIANVVKCRPPGNRDPRPDEVAQCLPYLQRQVQLLQPQIIVAMGRSAAQALLQPSLPEVSTLPLGKLRGRPHRFGDVPVVVTYHPAYLLRSLGDKAKAWADLCLALSLMQGRAVSANGGASDIA